MTWLGGTTGTYAANVYGHGPIYLEIQKWGKYLLVENERAAYIPYTDISYHHSPQCNVQFRNKECKYSENIFSFSYNEGLCVPFSGVHWLGHKKQGNILFEDLIWEWKVPTAKCESSAFAICQ